MLDDGAEAPRPRRADEAMEAGDGQEPKLFIMHPAIGVCCVAASHDGESFVHAPRERVQAAASCTSPFSQLFSPYIEDLATLRVSSHRGLLRCTLVVNS